MQWLRRRLTFLAPVLLAWAARALLGCGSNGTSSSGCPPAGADPASEACVRAELGIPEDARRVVVLSQSSHLDWDWLKTFDGYYANQADGVLSEAVSGAAGGDFAVVGIGLNVSHGPSDFPQDLRASSTSIRLAGGRAITVDAVWDALCRALDRWYNVLARGDKEAVIRTFERRAAFPPGAAVRVETAAETFEAKYRGLDAEGRLVVDRGGVGPVTLDAVVKLDGRP